MAVFCSSRIPVADAWSVGKSRRPCAGVNDCGHFRRDLVRFDFWESPAHPCSSRSARMHAIEPRQVAFYAPSKTGDLQPPRSWQRHIIYNPPLARPIVAYKGSKSTITMNVLSMAA